MSRTIEIVDTTTRDGNQSLWSATGLTAHDILSIAPTIEQVGFHALDFTSSTHMGVSVRFHREDPWELMRLMRAAMPTTLLNFITTGMRFITWQPCDEEVMRLAFRCVVRNGIRRFQIAEPSNSPEALRRIARMARQEGVEEIVVGMTYSISPVHTHAYYAERLAALADCRGHRPLLPQGSRRPADARRGARARAALPRDRADGRAAQPLHDRARAVRLHGGPEGGLRRAAHRGRSAGQRHVAADGRVDASRTSRRRATRTRSRPTRSRVCPRTSAELAREKRLPPGEPRVYDAAYYHHQLPGGMVTTTTRMLEEIRRPELFDAVLEEIARVRAEMGYPILVTPVSQFMVTQAMRNVIDEERWTNVSDETVRYFLGHYGEFAAPVDPEIAAQVLALPQADKLRDGEPVSLDGARERFGTRISDEELLLRLTMPAEQVDAMRPLAASALPRPSRAAPVVRLLRELDSAGAISYLRVQKGDDLVVWRRAS